ncbi:hypothetical protein PRK78_001126 [Emydomyces testavorans]|uniref:Pentatricopeptide repeat protein n=1 Tax=Emydomyces testavorans TaxID=2070801 RepID=A0AAF0IGH4_9EURO|nr:hypothetical protein PRK78_001126 [Emydomyces testavorans]
MPGIFARQALHRSSQTGYSQQCLYNTFHGEGTMARHVVFIWDPSFNWAQRGFHSDALRASMTARLQGVPPEDPEFENDFQPRPHPPIGNSPQLKNSLEHSPPPETRDPGSETAPPSLQHEPSSIPGRLEQPPCQRTQPASRTYSLNRPPNSFQRAAKSNKPYGLISGSFHNRPTRPPHSADEHLSLAEYMQQEKRRDSFLWDAVRNPAVLSLLRVQVQRRKLDDEIADAARKYAGFVFNRKSYGIEFEARWNSLYPHSVIRPDWNRKFQTLFKNKSHGTSNEEIWSLLRLQDWTVVENWAEHFKDTSSGKSFWSGLTHSEKCKIWPDIAFWLLLNSPVDMLSFLESTHIWPYPPCRMASECFLYLDAYHYKDLTSTPEAKHYYHHLMRRTVGPDRWPAFSVSQRGLRVYLKHCDLNQLKEAFEKAFKGEVYVSANTLLYFMDRFNQSHDADNSLRALQLVPSRVNEWITVESEVVARRCARLLTMDTARDENGTRTFRLLPEILNLGIKPRREMLNILIQNAIKIGDPDMAWDIFNHSKIPPDSYTYLTLLDDATNRDDTERLETCHRLIASDHSVKRQPHILSKILHALYGLLYNAPPGTEFRVFNTMLQSYCQGHDPQPLRDLGIVQKEQELPQYDRPSSPSSHALVLMISGYLRLYKNTTRIIEVYNRFRELVRQGHDSIGRLAETDHIYNAFLTALQPDERMIRESIMIVQNMHDPLPETAVLQDENRPIRQAPPTVLTWNILLNTVMSHGQLAAVDMIRQVMRQQGVEVDTSIWNAMLQGYAKLQMVDEVARTLKSMLLENLTPDRYTFGSLKRIRHQAKLRKSLDRLGVDSETLTLMNHASERTDTAQAGDELDVSRNRIQENLCDNIPLMKADMIEESPSAGS